MTLSASLARAPRCALVNVTTGESMECLFNPAELSEKLQVNWNRMAVPGLSHQVLQFQSTSNRQLSGVEFYVNRVFASESGAEEHVAEFRAFLRSLTVPPEGTEGVPATAPPRVLVVWPGVITVECVIASVEFQYRQFGVDGGLLVYAASVTFEEILDTRVTSEELRADTAS